MRRETVWQLRFFTNWPACWGETSIRYPHSQIKLKQISSNAVQVLRKGRTEEWNRAFSLNVIFFWNSEKLLCFWPDKRAFFSSSGGFWKVLVSPRLIDLSQATEDSAILHFELRHVNTTKAPVTVWCFLPRAALECTWVLDYSCIRVDASVHLHLSFPPSEKQPDFVFLEELFFAKLSITYTRWFAGN